MKKLLSLLLALCMLFALAACGAADDAADDAAADDAAADDAASDDAAADDAAASGDTYTITWYMGGNAQADMPMVQEALAAYINETYGMNIALNIVQTPFGDLGQKMAMVLSSGEDWDLCYTASWSNNYAQNMANGAYMALEDLLPEYAPDLYEFVGGYWASVTSDGHIWAVPNIQLEYKWNFTSIPTYWVDMYNAANPDKALAQENINVFADLNDFFYWAKENVIDAGVAFNGVVPSYVTRSGYDNNQYAYLMEDTGVAETYFQFGDETNTVKTWFDFEDYIADLTNYQNRWFNDGLVPSDLVTADFANTDLAALQYMLGCGVTFKPGEDVNTATYWGLTKEEMTYFTLGEPWSGTGAVLSTLTAVNANCKNPEVVLQFLNIINTDATAFNMLCFGVEGYHYDVVDGCVATSTENTGYDPNCDWAFGNQFLAIPRAGQDADIWEVTQEMNSKANISCAMGFMPDATPVETQVANVNVIVEQYKKTLNCGAIYGSADDFTAMIEQYKADCYAAGLQDIVDELQSQVDAWMAANA